MNENINSNPAPTPTPTPSLEDQIGEMLGSTGEQPANATEPTAEVPVQSTGDDQTPPDTEPTNSSSKQDEGNNNVIRQMRETHRQQKAELDKQRAILQKLADQQGVSVEELESQIQAAEDKKTAEQKGIPVEVQALMRQQEARIRQLEEQTIKQDFNARANNLMKANNLTEQQFIEFAQQAQATGIDIFKPGTNLDTLYKAVNFEKLISTKEAELRQKILNDMQAQKEAGSRIPGTPNTPPTGTARTTTDANAEIDFFMTQVQNSLKK